jgi:hypothetical protein
MTERGARGAPFRWFGMPVSVLDPATGASAPQGAHQRTDATVITA